MELWVCEECGWEGEEYKLLVAGKGLTHFYECPRCNSYEVDFKPHDWEVREDGKD